MSCLTTGQCRGRILPKCSNDVNCECESKSAGGGPDGTKPLAGLIFDGNGNVYHNTSEGGAYSGAVDDFNSDGKPDLVTANAFGFTLSVLLNNTIFSEPANIESPAPNSTVTGSTVTFHWDASDQATAFWIDVGSVAGGNQYYQSQSLATTVFSAKVTGLPTDGSTVYVTMYSLINGQWQNNQYTYTSGP